MTNYSKAQNWSSTTQFSTGTNVAYMPVTLATLKYRLPSWLPALTRPSTKWSKHDSN